MLVISDSQYRSDEAIIDQSVDPTVLHHGPSVLSSGDVSFAVKGDVYKCITIDESTWSAGLLRQTVE